MFWGERVHARGVGPSPIPVDDFTLPKLVDAIKYMLEPKVIPHIFQKGSLSFSIVKLKLRFAGKRECNRTCERNGK